MTSKTSTSSPLPAKPAVESKSLWGSALGSLPLLYLIEQKFDLPTGILNDTLVAVFGAAGVALQIFSRLKSNHAPISGLVKTRK